MTMNRFITSLVQLFLCLPIFWYVRELIRDRKKR